jgi:hypothetical protein
MFFCCCGLGIFIRLKCFKKKPPAAQTANTTEIKDGFDDLPMGSIRAGKYKVTEEATPD